MSLLVAVIILGLLVLVLEIIDLRKAIISLAVVSLLGLFGKTVYELYANTVIWEIEGFSEMMVHDKFAQSFSALFLLLTAFILCVIPFATRERPTQRSDYSSIILFLVSGAIAMVSFSNLAMFFIGLELLSISLYLLTASNVKSIWSNEAGIKYFLMGSFASSVVLFGIALIYGAIGTFNMHEIVTYAQSGNTHSWYAIGVSLILVGMLFKVAAAPFHFWAPDVYQGAPTVITMLMSTLVKVAAMATLYKLMDMLIINLQDYQRLIIIVISILTMTVGNITAIWQNNLKRLMAYSGISHAGFMLMSVLTLHRDAQILLYYVSAYALSGITVFAVIIAVCHAKNSQDISMFRGLGRKHPFMATMLTFSLLSMAGIPIFSGFWAKLFQLNQMMQIGEMTLVIFGVVNSIISLYYYFRIINIMFLKEDEGNENKIAYPKVMNYVAGGSMLVNLALGIFPSLITNLNI